MCGVSKLVAPRKRILPERRISSSQSIAGTAPRTSVSHQWNWTRSRRSTPSRASEPVDDRLDVGLPERRQPVEIGHELGMDLQRAGGLDTPPGREPRPEGADQRLDAGVDVGTVEGGEAGVERRLHRVERLGLGDRAMAAGELPVAADDSGDRVAGPELNRVDHRLGSWAAERRWWRHG